jgi:hypothetical protein
VLVVMVMIVLFRHGSLVLSPPGFSFFPAWLVAAWRPRHRRMVS